MRLKKTRGVKNVGAKKGITEPRNETKNQKNRVLSEKRMRGSQAGFSVFSHLYFDLGSSV